MQKTVYDHIAVNNFKTWVLVALFPISLVVLFAMVLFFLLVITAEPATDYRIILNTTIYNVKHFSFWVMGIGVLWMGIVWFFGGDMMLSFAGAKELTPDEKANRKLFRLVETTALAAGLPCPKVYLIEDESLNAFATGRDPHHAAVSLTSGIVKKLSPLELQGVIAHELAHIGNRDVALNMMLISGVSIFGFLAEILFRFQVSGSSQRNNDSKGSFGLIIIATGITFMLFHAVIAPLLRLAVSRTREYGADSTGALITRNPQALADALKKISQDARVEVLDSAKQMAVACIYTPLKVEAFSLTSTHPPVEERIKRLEEMAGKMSNSK